MPKDIRDIQYITPASIQKLNFVRSSPSYTLRRHYRQGLRSHILEILDPSDVALEKNGVELDGIRWFPRAKPKMMFRIFRTRLKSLEDGLEEIERVRIVERYLAPNFMAVSTECIVDYRKPVGRELLLCGFQEFMEGVVLDPWTVLETDELLSSLYEACRTGNDANLLPRKAWFAAIKKNGNRFVGNIKRMITQTGHIPDLAGVGNLILTPMGGIRLVDINNISPIAFANSIPTDEKGYPVCDKSVEALSLIERKIVGHPVDMNEKLYEWFLAPGRREAVKEKEARFWRMKAGDRPD